MTALRLIKRRRRKLPVPKRMCNGCLWPIPRCDDVYCDDCASDCDCPDDGLDMDAQRELARVYLDLKVFGQQKDAIERLERVLDAEAPFWRELA